MSIKINKYLKLLLNKHPSIASGRKNYDKFEERIGKNINLIKEMIDNKGINKLIEKKKKNKKNSLK